MNKTRQHSGHGIGLEVGSHRTGTHCAEGVCHAAALSSIRDLLVHIVRYRMVIEWCSTLREHMVWTTVKLFYFQ